MSGMSGIDLEKLIKEELKPLQPGFQNNHIFEVLTREAVGSGGVNQNFLEETLDTTLSVSNIESSGMDYRGGSLNRTKEKLFACIIDTLKEYLKIDDISDKDYLINLITEVKQFIEYVDENVLMQLGEVKGVFGFLQKFNQENGRGMDKNTLNSLSVKMNAIISLDSSFENKKSGALKDLLDVAGSYNVLGLDVLLLEYPELINHKGLFEYLIRVKGIKSLDFVGKGVNGLIISIGNDEIVKLYISKLLDVREETSNHRIFYETLQYIKNIKSEDYPNIFIPYLSDDQVEGSIEMQEIKGKTLLHFSIQDFFKDDLKDIGYFITSGKDSGIQSLKILYDRLTTLGVDFNSDMNVVKYLNDKDLENIFLHKKNKGSLNTSLLDKDISDCLMQVGWQRKSNGIESSVRRLMIMNNIFDEDIIRGYYKKLQNQLKSIEEDFGDYGLAHNDFHQGNCMIEWDDKKNDFNLYIIDFGKVSINRSKNHIKMHK